MNDTGAAMISIAIGGLLMYFIEVTIGVYTYWQAWVWLLLTAIVGFLVYELLREDENNVGTEERTK